MKKQLSAIALAALVLASITSCKKKDSTTNNTSCVQCGYDFSKEHLDSVPTSLNTRSLSNLVGAAPGNLPSSVDLTKYLPPIGNQGQYGTCVAWASAYNMKSALEAISSGLTTSQLTSTGNQMSPKDLYLAIADNYKNGCEGTNFEYAMQVLQQRGVATFQTVPYDNLGNCSNTNSDPSWATSAAQHKIKSYRKLDENKDAIKQALANNQPVVIGAIVGTNFQNWRSNAVMGAGGSGFDPVGTGQGGGHAMLCVGYDDSKGSGGAFRIVNSWDNTWGDNGGFWVDYDFMVTTLCNENGVRPFFVADDLSDTTRPQPNNPTSTGVDLATWADGDFSTYGSSGVRNRRELDFDIYNIGTGDAASSANWGLYYIYYNAYNANDYDVIFYDNFNTSIAQNTYQFTGNNCVINYTIASGHDLAAAFGFTTLSQTYDMPSISGAYYLVLLADPNGSLADVNYDNNIFYTSDYPFYFNAGYSAKTGSDFTFRNDLSRDMVNIKKSKYNTAVKPQKQNAYRPDEIMAFLKEKKRTGELDRKVAIAASKGNNVGQIRGNK